MPEADSLPPAVLPPDGWQRGPEPERPEDKGHGQSRAREWPKHASPRTSRAQCPFLRLPVLQYQSQNAKRASSQKRHMVISIFLPCNSLILMSIAVGSISAIKGV